MHAKPNFDLSSIDSSFLLFIYLLPNSFFPLAMLYLAYQEPHYYNLALSNILYNFIFTLTPLLITSAKFIAKTLYKDPNIKQDMNTIFVGTLCLIFMALIYSFIFYKFDFSPIKISDILQILALGHVISLILATFVFSYLYFYALKNTIFSFKVKISKLSLIAILPVTLSTVNILILLHLV